MHRSNHSLGDLLEELSSLAAGLGLICFVVFPFAIPFVALTLAFAAPVFLAMIVLAVIATPPLLLIAWLTRKGWARPPERRDDASAIDLRARTSIQPPPTAMVTSTRSPGSHP
jgi:hypothetical protein